MANDIPNQKQEEQKKKDNFDTTKFAAKSALLGMGVDIGTDLGTNAAAFAKEKKNQIKKAMKQKGLGNKLKAVKNIRGTKELLEHLKEQQKGALGIGTLFAGGSVLSAYLGDKKKNQENQEGNKMENKIAEELEFTEEVIEDEVMDKEAKVKCAEGEEETETNEDTKEEKKEDKEDSEDDEKEDKEEDKEEDKKKKFPFFFNKKASEEEEGIEKEAAESGMAAIPGTTLWIKAKGGNKKN